MRQRSESDALQALALMHQGITVDITVDITPEIAVQSAKNSLLYQLPMADSIMITVARMFDAVLWTQDVDFKALAGVRYKPKYP